MPASPYANTRGASKAIRFAREAGVPFLGTCGGFQHAVLEYAGNVARLRTEHAETDPGAEAPVIAPLECALVEETGGINFPAGSRLRAIHGVARAQERYHCWFGLNRACEAPLERYGLAISGRDDAGEARAIELPAHPFSLATLFQPERAALAGRNHPPISAFVRAAVR